MDEKKYSYGEWVEELTGSIQEAAEELERIGTENTYSFQAHLRSYNLLESLWLLDHFTEHIQLVEKNVSEEEFATLKAHLQEAIELFCLNYERYHDAVKDCYDQEEMEESAARYLKPWEEKVARAEERLQKMKKLHAIARKASDIFQGHNFFRKFFILRTLRKEAGFKLRRNRVCNFAAKTFDLVNEAQSDLNQVRNGLHKCNVKYKCIGDLYLRINRQLSLVRQELL